MWNNGLCDWVVQEIAHARLCTASSHLTLFVLDAQGYQSIIPFAVFNAPLPQLDRGADYESGRRGFESLTAHHLLLVLVR